MLDSKAVAQAFCRELGQEERGIISHDIDVRELSPREYLLHTWASSNQYVSGAQRIVNRELPAEQYRQLRFRKVIAKTDNRDQTAGGRENGTAV